MCILQESGMGGGKFVLVRKFWKEISTFEDFLEILVRAEWVRYRNKVSIKIIASI